MLAKSECTYQCFFYNLAKAFSQNLLNMYDVVMINEGCKTKILPCVHLAGCYAGFNIKGYRMYVEVELAYALFSMLGNIFEHRIQS